jgi:predicted methyltransferase
MNRTTSLLATSALAAVLALTVGCATTGGGSAAKPSAAVAAAVADKARPDADRTRDADRKPAEVIAFAGIKAGDKVGDIMPGGGYFTRLFSAVVGSKGTVYALAPPRAANAPANAPDMAAAVKAIAADAHYANVKVGSSDVATPVPEKLDVMWTSLNYHDFQNRPEGYMKSYNKWVFDALKPGGTYIVIDHAAKVGAGKSVTSTLHRVEPAYVKQEVIAAGFQFVGESKVLENPADDRSQLVRETGIRGKTDQFVFKFRKPK